MIAQVEEQETLRWTMTLRDETDAVIPDGDISSILLTVFDSRSGAIVNDVSGTNILNVDRGTLMNSVLTVLFQPADNTIVNTALTARTMERHSAQLVVGYGAGKMLRKEIDIYVKQMAQTAVAASYLVSSTWRVIPGGIRTRTQRRRIRPMPTVMGGPLVRL